MQLDSAHVIEDMNFHNSHLHPLKENMRGLWSIRVDGNWRIIFRFESADAYIINYVDYH